MTSPLGQRKSLPDRRLSEARRIEWTYPLNPDGWPHNTYVTIGHNDGSVECEQ